MKRTTFNILFYIKKTKLLKDGTAPIFLRITINGKSSEKSIKRSCLPKLWDSNKTKVKGNSDVANEINEFIKTL